MGAGPSPTSRRSRRWLRAAGTGKVSAVAAGVDVMSEFLRRTHLSAPSDVPAIVAGEAARMGARDVSLYVVDLELANLVPVTERPDAPAEPLSLAGTVAGRCFVNTAILRTPGGPTGEQRIWLPLMDGTERLGVLGMTFPAALDDEAVALCERFTHLVAMTLVAKSAYGDVFTVTRRQRPITIAAELSQELAPPLVFATDDLALAGMLEPCYDNGGDAVDYAVNGRVLHLGVFDAMGHGLPAAGVAAFALSAYRFSRRTGKDLLETYAAMDEAVGDQFPGERFVTAVIAQLDVDTGQLQWVSAGHPPPLIIRDGRGVRVLEAAGTTPLGVPAPAGPPQVASESLQPGDLLLFYTDGLTDARGPDGELFGMDGLTAFVEREAAAGLTAPETLRRLRQAVVRHDRSALRDDASALLVEWRRGSEVRLAPQTVV